MISTNEARYYDFGHFRLDISNGQLLKNNETIPLTTKSVEILRFLVQNRGEILNKTRFFDTIWAESYVDETNLTQHIYRIRKVLEDTESGNIYIETIPKYGYRFIADVKEVFDDSSEVDPKKKEKDVWNTISELEKDGDQNHNPKPDSDKTNLISLKTSEHNNVPRHLAKLLLNKKVILALIIGASISMLLYQALNYLAQNRAAGSGKTSVVVLPFNQIGDNDERLGLGTSDAIISKLGSLKRIAVNPTESIINYSKKESPQYNENLFDTGKRLNADIIVTGTVQREGEFARITVKFYQIKDKRQLCSAKFDEEFSNVFTLQDSISGQVLEKLLYELDNHQEHLD